MSLRPISEEEKMYLEAGRSMAKIANDPKTRGDLYRALKKADPTVKWPDQDFEEFKAEWRAEQEEKEIKRENDRRKKEMEDQREVLVKRLGEPLTKKIEALMERHGLADYALGAKLYAAENPPTPTSQSQPDSNRWQMPTDEKLLKDPSAWANEMAHQVIGEFRRKTLPR